MTRPNTRYNPYPSSRPARPRRESPPPENWGNQARSHHHQLTIRIYAFLDDLHLLHADRHLCEIFREHAKQPGPLGEAIRTWVEYVDVSTLLACGWPRLANGWLLRHVRIGRVANQSLAPFLRLNTTIKVIGAMCQNPFRGAKIDRLSSQLINRVHPP